MNKIFLITILLFQLNSFCAHVAAPGGSAFPETEVKRNDDLIKQLNQDLKAGFYACNSDLIINALQNGADPNFKFDGWNIITHCCLSLDIRLIKAIENLKEHDAIINVYFVDSNNNILMELMNKMKNGLNATDCSEIINKVMLFAKTLIKLQINLNHQNYNGDTFLHLLLRIASPKNHFVENCCSTIYYDNEKKLELFRHELINECLFNSANIFIKNNEGVSVYDQAIASSREIFVSFRNFILNRKIPYQTEDDVKIAGYLYKKHLNRSCVIL